MIEFLLPKEDLKPVILIQPAYTLKAMQIASKAWSIGRAIVAGN